MKLLTLILYTFFIFAIPVFGQTEIQDILDSSRRSEFSKNYQEAVNKVNKAIDIEPSNPDLYLRKAHLYIRLDNKNAVLENVLIAISLNSDDYYFWGKCVKQLNLSGQYQESLKIIDKLFSLNKENTTFWAYKIRYQTRFSSKDYAGAIQDIIKIQDLASAYDDDRESFVDAEGNVLLTEGLLVKTLDGLKNDPNVFVYYNELFKIVEKRKNGPYTLGSAMRTYSLSIDLYAGYAVAYEGQHTTAEVAALFDKYAKELSLETRAAIYKKMGRYELAVKDLTDVLKSTRQQSSYLVERGNLYMLMKQFKEALFDYAAAKKIDKEWTTLDEKIVKAKQLLADNTQSK